LKNSSDPFDLTTATFTFKYDAWNRLASGWLTTLPGFVVSYEYDGLNRRIRKSGPAPQPGHYYYNEDWQLLEERATSDPDPRAQYVWHPYYIDALAVRYWDGNTDGDYLDTNEGAQYYLQDANYNVTSLDQKRTRKGTRKGDILLFLTRRAWFGSVWSWLEPRVLPSVGCVTTPSIGAMAGPRCSTRTPTTRRFST